MAPGSGFLGKEQEFVILYFFILGAVSIPLAVILIVITLHLGHTTHFSPSDKRLSYVSGPDSRGTMDLIWTCLSTVFTCVYVSVHVDVPDDSKSKQFLEGLQKKNEKRGVIFQFLLKCFGYVCRFTATSLFRRTLWMLFNIFAPELVVFIAVIEKASAKDTLLAMRARGQRKWTSRLAFFADMGGFEMEDGTHLEDGRRFLKWLDETLVKRKDEGKGLELDAVGIEKDVNDRSKQDTVVKLFTVCQASWFFIQCVVRLAERRGISELEVATCAYIACTVITYSCWLHKPYDVKERVIVRDGLWVSRHTVLADAVEWERAPTNATAVSCVSLDDALYSRVPITDEEKEHIPSLSLPQKLDEKARYTPLNRAFFNPKKAWPLGCYIAGLAGAIVGFIHAIPLWNTLFIITTGQWLWRACCLIQIILTIFATVIAFIEDRFKNIGNRLFFLTAIVAFLFCVSRVGIFILIGLSFWSLPASVYTDIDWSWSAVPHFH
ncbi:hypothetical protein QCA50_005245 [Cerrena zonata]|uniref:Uncharacterized protein n=1 Tax=Cerrena zonata TaxID=2478898 RepID=A0AAW0GGE7_9APHY